jgi:hypothetical protein
MGDVFCGWRRKVGVLTLLMACVFAAGWVRSKTKYDFVTLNLSNSVFKAGSYSGITRLVRETTDGKAAGEEARKPKRRANTSQFFRWNSGLSSSMEGPKVGWDTGYEVQWNWEFCDFSCGSATRGDGHFQATTAPYWSIVTPVTLLSAFLLLSKPRPTNQKIIVEPIAEKVE